MLVKSLVTRMLTTIGKKEEDGKVTSIVKIKDPVVVNELVAMGFSYVIETINERILYCFPLTPEIKTALTGKFGKSSILVENKLRF